MPQHNGSPMHPQRTLPAAIAATFLAGACMVFDKNNAVVLSSDPPGARVLVNSKDSGFVTPCALGLDTGRLERIDLVYPGYETAVRILTSDHQLWVILWRDMYIDSSVWHFPLWLNLDDFFMPVKYDEVLSPTRVFVRLERTADK